MREYVVGVDGGTSKTIALVADEAGQILGAGRGAGSNWIGSDVRAPMQVVIETVEDALTRAGMEGGSIEVGVFGLAGADWPEDYERREAVLADSGVVQKVIVKNDALLGWRAGSHQPYGVVITAGTGTNTAVITPDGREWCYGYYARYGGAQDIGQEAIDAVLREEDGRGASTSLSGMVLEKLAYPSAEALLRDLIADAIERRQVYSLCPLVFEAAHSGDEVATSILSRQGLALAEYARASIRRFEMQDLEFDVVLSGSVFKGKGTLLIDTIEEAIHRVAPRARVVRPSFEPAVGAVLLAYDELRIPVTEEINDNLSKTVPGSAVFDTLEPG